LCVTPGIGGLFLAFFLVFAAGLGSGARGLAEGLDGDEVELAGRNVNRTLTEAI